MNTTVAFALAASLVSRLAKAQYAPQYQDQNAQSQDPPSRVARISVVNGNVSLEPAGLDVFSQAELNYPLTAGDRVYADNASMSELQTSGLALRMGNGADVTLSSLTDDVAQFGLAQGSIRLRTRDLDDPDGTEAQVEVDTPNGTIVVTRPGDLRVDSYPQDDTTVVTVTEGEAQITGPNLNTALRAGQSLRLAGTNPVYTQALRLLPPDALDNFDTSRERERSFSIRESQPYVDPGMIGVADLATYGDWSPDPEYGAVWFPRAVNAGWTPYSNGHWAWVAPWGWTWIEAETWGFAPFHYGRWAAFNGRWGWVPGPPPSLFAGGRPPRPVYSPALVAFVGGPRFSLSVGFGAQSGAGITAWFPLGPREAYQPWYHSSPAYVNRVNVTNLYTRNVTEVRNTYNNRTTNVYNVTNVTYVNRPTATVAVVQRDFADGRGVAQSQHLRMDSTTQRQLLAAPILPHPLVTPQAGAAAPQAPARALPPNQNRPVVETRQGFERAGDPRTGANAAARGNNLPQYSTAPQPGVAPHMPAAIQRVTSEPISPRPGQVSAGAGMNGANTTNQLGQRQDSQQRQGQQPTQAGLRANYPQQRNPAPVAPGQPPVTQQLPMQSAPVAMRPQQQQSGDPNRIGNSSRQYIDGGRRDQQAASQPQPQPQPAGRPTTVRTPASSAPSSTIAPQVPAGARNAAGTAAPQRSSPEPQTQQYNLGRPVQRAPQDARPLINRAVPQPAQPSFPQQQRAIQSTDPGRPLGPRQVQNLRQGQPAGVPAQPDPVPHPPAAGRREPASRPANGQNPPTNQPPK